MRIKRALARGFFVASVVALLASIFHIPMMAQEIDPPLSTDTKCDDGLRKMCESGPLPNGGTYYKYWV